MKENKRLADLLNFRLEYIPLELIELNDYNVNQLELPQYETLEKNLLSYGLLQPIMVRKNGSKYEVIDGQHRLMIMKKYPHLFEKVPCVVVDCDRSLAEKFCFIFTFCKGSFNLGKAYLHWNEKAEELESFSNIPLPILDSLIKTPPIIYDDIGEVVTKEKTGYPFRMLIDYETMKEIEELIKRFKDKFTITKPLSSIILTFIVRTGLKYLDKEDIDSFVKKEMEKYEFIFARNVFLSKLFESKFLFFQPGKHRTTCDLCHEKTENYYRIIVFKSLSNLNKYSLAYVCFKCIKKYEKLFKEYLGKYYRIIEEGKPLWKFKDFFMDENLKEIILHSPINYKALPKTKPCRACGKDVASACRGIPLCTDCREMIREVLCFLQKERLI